jgi:hypothetical protein
MSAYLFLIPDDDLHTSKKHRPDQSEEESTATIIMLCLQPNEGPRTASTQVRSPYQRQLT